MADDVINKDNESNVSVANTGSTDDNNASVDNTGSAADGTSSDKSADSSGDVDVAELKQMLEEQLRVNQDLVKVLGRQGEELGQLRKAVGTGNDSNDVDYREYFDNETAEAIKKLVSDVVQNSLGSFKQQTEAERVQQEFAQLSRVYELDNEKAVRALGFFADSYGKSLTDAAEELAQMGLLQKKGNNGTANQKKVDAPDLNSAPKGRRKDVAGSGGDRKSYTDFTVDEWARLSSEERERILQEVSSF